MVPRLISFEAVRVTSPLLSVMVPRPIFPGAVSATLPAWSVMVPRLISFEAVRVTSPLSSVMVPRPIFPWAVSATLPATSVTVPRLMSFDALSATLPASAVTVPKSRSPASTARLTLPAFEVTWLTVKVPASAARATSPLAVAVSTVPLVASRLTGSAGVPMAFAVRLTAFASMFGVVGSLVLTTAPEAVMSTVPVGREMVPRFTLPAF